MILGVKISRDSGTNNIKFYDQSAGGNYYVEMGDQDKQIILDEGWAYKKKISSNISNEIVDDYYIKAKKLGAIGGKLIGAGGGGFLLLYVPEKNQKKIRTALKEFTYTPFKFESEGSRIINY